MVAPGRACRENPNGGRLRQRLGKRYALVIDLAIQGVASLLMGAGLGYWLKARYGAPAWVQILCTVLGVAAAVVTMIRYQRRFEKLDELDERSEGEG